MENSSEQAVSLLPVNEMDELAFLNKNKKKEKIAVIFCCSKRLPKIPVYAFLVSILNICLMFYLCIFVKETNPVVY